MKARAVISGYATLDFVARSPEPPVGARTYPAEIGAAWPRAGGAPLYAGRRLAAHGIAAAPLVTIGNDRNGEIYRNACVESGLFAEGLAALPGRTPACVLIHHPGGGCTCFLDPGVAADGLSEPQASALQGAELVVIAAGPAALTSEVLAKLRPDQRLAWIAKADPACFPPALAERIASRAEAILCNNGERPFVDMARLAAPPGQVLVETRGAGGVLIESATGVALQRVVPVETEDATGAGDTFAGEFLARRLLGADLDQAAAAGAEAARALLMSRAG